MKKPSHNDIISADACQMFDQMSERDLSTWTLIFRGCASHGHVEKVCELIQKMDWEGMTPNKYILVSVLKVCSILKSLEKGKQVHAWVIESGCDIDVFLGSTLVNMYSKCGSIEDACLMFDTIPRHSAVLWSNMLAGYAQHGLPKQALSLFWKMEREGVKPNEVTFITILTACSSIGVVKEGNQIHDSLIKNELDSGTLIGNSLVDMYSKCGSVVDAHRVFDKIAKSDVVSWSALIAGYAAQGNAEEALRLFSDMTHKGIVPNDVTFLSLLKACVSVGHLDNAKEIHALIILHGFELGGLLGNTLVHVYAKCGSLEDACQVFTKMLMRDVVSWSTLIAGHAHHGLYKESLKLFDHMVSEGVKPNLITFVSSLKACASLKLLELGNQMHVELSKNSLNTDAFVGTTLVDMYIKCGCVEDAQQVFNKMLKQNVMSWSAMIAGYAQHGNLENALEMFGQMQEEGVKPDEVTYISILKACTNLAMLEQGRQIHNHMLEIVFEWSDLVGCALVDMYTKCGSIEDASEVFSKLKSQDGVSWNAMIVGYAQHGCAEDVFQASSQMHKKGIKLDHVSFVGILSACSHAGLIDEGCHYFMSISENHGIFQTMEHYVCMVDLLGRAGRLLETMDFIERMPSQPNAALWMSLLGACRIKGDMELAREVTDNLLESEPQNAAAFVLLSNIAVEFGG